MSPRKFDRFMVDVELSGNPKIGRLNDAEFRCLLTGVWALAAKADPRGFLLVGPMPAEPEDVARQARCTVAVARRTLEKLRTLEMLEADEPTGWEWVHDWDEINPGPKPSDAPERTRDRKRKSRGGHAAVTRDTADSHAPEVEVEVEGEEPRNPSSPSELGQARAETDLFAYWQQTCGHDSAKFTADRRAKVRARLREGYTPEQIRAAIDGAARAAFVNDQGKRFDDLELICRTGSKLEGFIGRASAVPSIPSGRRLNGPTAEDFLAAGGGTP